MTCNRDCFNCPFADCIVDEVTAEERLLSDRRDLSAINDRHWSVIRAKRYEISDKGKERMRRYNASTKGRARDKKYRQSDKGRKANSEACKRYYLKRKAERGNVCEVVC